MIDNMTASAITDEQRVEIKSRLSHVAVIDGAPVQNNGRDMVLLRAAFTEMERLEIVLQEVMKNRDELALAMESAKPYVPPTDSLFNDCEGHNRSECLCGFCCAYRDAEIVEAVGTSDILAAHDARVRREENELWIDCAESMRTEILNGAIFENVMLALSARVALRRL